MKIPEYATRYNDPTVNVNDMKSFYKYLNNDFNCENVTIEDLKRIKELSKELNYYYNYKDRYINILKMQKYVQIMNKIKTNPKFKMPIKHQYLLFMYSIDPNFEIAKLYSNYEDENQLKEELKKKFFIIDKNLIFIEMTFLRDFHKSMINKRKIK